MDFTVICQGLQGLSLRFWGDWDISISHIAALRCRTGLFCPSARLNFSQGDLEVIMSASLNVADCSEIHIRLVQFKPAWTIHCLLRFKNLPYLCENTCSKDSLGLKVPLLIDGNFVFAERLAIEHLSMDRQTRAADGDYPPNAASIFDTEHNQFLLADKIMSDHIEVALLLVHEQLESILESIAKKGVCGLSVPAIVFGKLRSFIKSFDIDSEK